MRGGGHGGGWDGRAIKSHHAPLQQAVHGFADAGVQWRFGGQHGDRGGGLQPFQVRRQRRQHGQRKRVLQGCVGIYWRLRLILGRHHTQRGHQGLQALPPAVGGFAVRLDRGDHQRAAGAGHGDIQGVEFFAPAGQLFLRQHSLGANRRAFFRH